MAYETRELSGSLFKNNRREKESQPQATGECLIDGVPYWVSAWTKRDKNGNPWQSLAFKPKEERAATGKPIFENGVMRSSRPEAPKQQDNGGSGFEDLDNDIPF